MSEAILDGIMVDASTITSAHRFIGMWRPPVDPQKAIVEENLRRPPEKRFEVLVCPGCGKHQWFVDQQSVHWKQGCYDLPQYITEIKE